MLNAWKSKTRAFCTKEKSQLIILGLSFLFLIVCAVFIKYQKLWFPYSVFGLFALYLLLFKMDTLLYLTAFLTPFSININEFMPDISYGLSFPSEALMLALMLMFLAKILYENHYNIHISKHPISLAIIFYLLWLGITSITSTIPWVSVKFLISKLWFIIPFYFFLCQLVEKDIKKSITFFLSYALGLALIVCITTVKHLQMGDVEKVSHWVMSPYYNDHTAYGAVLAFFVCIVGGLFFIPHLTKKQKTASAILFPILLVGLYLSFSRAAWLSVIISMGVWVLLLLKIKMKSVLIFIGTVVVLFFTFQSTILHQLNKNEQESSNNFLEHFQSITNISSDASNVERINRWTSAWRMFKEKPVFGYGPGTYQFKYAPFQRSKFRTIITTNSGDGGNAHSEYLGPLAETGLVGMLSVMLIVFLCIYKGIHIYYQEKQKSIRILSLMCTLALISYYTHGIMNNFLDTDKLAVPVFGAMAVITALDIYRKHNHNINTVDNENK
jgi:putative inorganic carbon (HCO3(-)) transporter